MSLNLIRKVFWPAAIALGFLVLLGAVNGSVKTVSADNDGEFCSIIGPKVITVGKTYLYVGVLTESNDDHATNVSLDNIVGNSKITSILDGDDFDDYQKINPSNNVHDLDETNVFDIDDDLFPFLKDQFNTSIAPINPGCGNLRDTLLEMIEEAIDRGSACNFFQTVRTDGDCIVNNTIASGAQNTETLYNDFDIDCPTAGNCNIAGNIITAVVDAMVKDITAGENDCDDIADDAEDAAIGAGAAEIIAAQFNDYINDVCEGRFEDEFINSVVVVDVTCNSAGNFDITFSDEKDEEDSISMNVICRGPASDRSTIDVTPKSVEIVPAVGNVSHALVTVRLLDSEGNQAGEGAEVDFTVNRCSIETSGVLTTANFVAANTVFGNLNVSVPSTATDIETSAAAVATVDSTRNADTTVSFLGNNAGDRTVAAAVLGCNPADAPGATPGVATITAIIAVGGGQDIVKTVDVNVVGPPFSMTIAASPTSVRCGEKATITATVKDAIGQNVSEHTRVEAVTNAGGVLGGTGAVANNSGPVVPISSTVGETFSGVATFYLLTSEQHTGPYEVVVTTGGAGALGNALGGVFSTPPVVIQTTVNCSLPAAPVVNAPQQPAAPTITAPRTGQGPTISPPNTGDAGLASASSSSLPLFAIVGVVAFAVAGLATVKFARR